MGSSTRLAPLYDKHAAQRAIAKAEKAGPLQSLTPRELALDCHALTIYPRPQQRVRAWVRFGPEPVRVDALLMRTTPSAAGIEFTDGEQNYRCWMWGNAVEVDE